MSARTHLALLLAAASAALASPVLASPCQGPAPAAGAQLSGTVLHVIDGDTLCLADGPTPDHWVQLQLDGAPGGGDATAMGKASLMSVAFAKKMTCVITGVDGAGARGRCSLDGEPVGKLLASVDSRSASQWLRPAS